MLSFENDYSRAAHPAVLEAVAEANNHLYSGYGSDELSDQAKAKIREALRAKGYTLTFEAPTNQIFVTMDQPTIDRLEREIKLGFTEKADDTHTVMRICTSWATTPEEVDQLIELL